MQCHFRVPLRPVKTRLTPPSLPLTESSPALPPLPPGRSVLADEVGRSLYEELDFRIEVRCAALHAVVMLRCFVGVLSFVDSSWMDAQG